MKIDGIIARVAKVNGEPTPAPEEDVLNLRNANPHLAELRRRRLDAAAARSVGLCEQLIFHTTTDDRMVAEPAHRIDPEEGSSRYEWRRIFQVKAVGVFAVVQKFSVDEAADGKDVYAVGLRVARGNPEEDFEIGAADDEAQLVRWHKYTDRHAPMTLAAYHAKLEIMQAQAETITDIASAAGAQYP